MKKIIKPSRTHLKPHKNKDQKVMRLLKLNCESVLNANIYLNYSFISLVNVLKLNYTITEPVKDAQSLGKQFWGARENKF